MNRLRDITVLLIALGMMLPLVTINRVKGDSVFDIAVYVEQRLYDNQDLGDAIDTYVADLQYEGWNPLVLFCNVTTTTPEGIRSILSICRFFYNITGCLLVGDFPYAIWEDPLGGGTYATDYYYMDLDGNWYDTDSDNIFDVHNGTIRPEIWASRLMASTVNDPTRNETELFLDYFAKNHENRAASSRALNAKPRALAYVDNQPAISSAYPFDDPDPLRSYDERFVNDTVDCLQKSYNDVTLVASPYLNSTNTNTTDYKNRLKNGDGYEWTWVYDHGSVGSHGFGKWYWYDSQWYWGYWNEGLVYSSSYYLPDTPKTFFYIFGSCNAAEFTEENCVANSAIFGKGNGLTSIGMTEGGGFPASWFSDAFSELGEHECIGEAFKTMYNSNIDYYDGTYVYKIIVLLGDPTLRINSPPDIPTQPSGPESGYLEVTYEYSANTTDLNGDQVWYQFDWDDGENTTVGPYDSGVIGNASHNWSCPGTYSVKVRAKDSYDVWGDWSEPLNVTINERIRYMQNAKWDSTYWKLFWNNTLTSAYRNWAKAAYCATGYLGVKIYKGTTCISGGNVIEVGHWYNLEDGPKSTTWECSEYNVTGTYIKIEIWYKFSGYSWTNGNVVFKTETFTENTILNSSTWTITLYGDFYVEGGPLKLMGLSSLMGLGSRSAIGFSWGSSSYPSRIEDMSFTH
jgi:hypothetical protein